MRKRKLLLATAALGTALGVVYGCGGRVYANTKRPTYPPDAMPASDATDAPTPDAEPGTAPPASE